MKTSILKLFILALVVQMLCHSCTGQRHVIQTVGESHSDTIFQTNVCHDSIYIDRYRNTFRKADTVYVENIRVEYRYRQLRDTLRVHKVDSVPVIREVEVVVHEPYIPWWSKLLSIAGGIALMVLTVKLITRYSRQGLLG